jgi:hypothetical protein
MFNSSASESRESGELGEEESGSLVVRATTFGERRIHRDALGFAHHEEEKGEEVIVGSAAGTRMFLCDAKMTTADAQVSKSHHFRIRSNVQANVRRLAKQTAVLA